MFAKYDRDGDGALTLRELFDMMHGNRCAADPFGVCMPPIYSNSGVFTVADEDALVGSCDFRVGHHMVAH